MEHGLSRLSPLRFFALLALGKCCDLGLSLGIDISLAVGPMSCLPNENAKPLTRDLLTAPLAHTVLYLKAESISGLASYPCHRHWLKGGRTRFQNWLYAYRKTGSNLYLMQGISFQFLTEGGKFSPAPPLLAVRFAQGYC